MALSGDGDRGDAGSVLIAGFRPFRAANPKLVTNEQIDQLRDQDGLRIKSQPAYPNHRPVAQVAERLEEAFNHASHVFWPEQISLLSKGLVRLADGRRKERFRSYLQNLLSSGLPVLPYDTAAALWHGEQRARLEARGLRPAFAGDTQHQRFCGF